MDVAIIGLGRMGLGLAERLINGGHNVVGYDVSGASLDQATSIGATAIEALEDVSSALVTPRVVWMMIPAGDPVEEMIKALLPHLSAGDILMDGGNSNFKDSVRRAEALKQKEIHYVDIGTSGGVWGLKEGFSLMVGGTTKAVEYIRPILETVAPSADRGWGHVGPCGAGHFVKMIHNGIEYGLMQAYAEGFAIMAKKKEFQLDVHQVSQIWQHGSVVRSWLLELISNALEVDPDLQTVAPYVQDSGMGRWTIQEAIDLELPAPVITLSVLQRLRSRDDNAYYDRLLAAMRNQFGGHAIKKVIE